MKNGIRVMNIDTDNPISIGNELIVAKSRICGTFVFAKDNVVNFDLVALPIEFVISTENIKKPKVVSTTLKPTKIHPRLLLEDESFNKYLCDKASAYLTSKGIAKILKSHRVI